MLRLRKFLRGCSGYLALLFLLISSSTIPSLFHPFHEHRAAQLAIDTALPMELLRIVLRMFQKLVLVMPLALGILYAIVWWTVTHGQRSARRWAIAASLAALLQGILCEDRFAAGTLAYNFGRRRNIAGSRNWRAHSLFAS
jgi:hypothetical protein